ncbi:taurine dioxygenase [Congregibacter litoralis]|uniref:Putative taurine catabolism dioxygenase n=1 Tax=Congregibacter litoralis KT71 TaxID=314285 RepID=A4ABM9_9GAMM|nr:taurine dioxygenase [Congregibacter litoralis]EAQ96542.1 putative taurine catabolism dioxygenase [Congregibacter litoralis KT71]
MNIKPVAGAIGAEVSDVDLCNPMTDDMKRSLRELVNRHELVFFRDQAITPAQQRDLAALFGPLQSHPAYDTVPDLPEVMVLESTPEKPSKIEVWHSDMTFRQHPPSITVLRGVEIPSVGGDTLWASMTAAYEALSPGMQRYLQDLTAVHDFSQGFKESLSEEGGRERLADALANNPPVRHPVIQTHPETGRKAIFVNALFTTHIEGISPLESAEVLQFLYKHSTTPEFTCRLRWAKDTVVIWDNRSTQHKPVNDFFPALRSLHRVVSEGDSPY